MMLSVNTSFLVLKYNQASRGVEGLQTRVAQRAATHNTWRQMKGMERVMYEVRIANLDFGISMLIFCAHFCFSITRVQRFFLDR